MDNYDPKKTKKNDKWVILTHKWRQRGSAALYTSKFQPEATIKPIKTVRLVVPLREFYQKNIFFTVFARVGTEIAM